MTVGVTGLRAVGLQEGAASARIKPLLPVLRPHGSRTQSYAESTRGSGTIKRPKCVVYDVRDTHTTCYLFVEKDDPRNCEEDDRYVQYKYIRWTFDQSRRLH
jgi:hypothetical protein